MATLDKKMTIEELKRTLEEAEIVKTAMELVLMNPHIKPAIKDKYAEALPQYASRIKNLQLQLSLYQKEEEFPG